MKNPLKCVFLWFACLVSLGFAQGMELRVAAYSWAGMPFLTLNLQNVGDVDFDSLVIGVYFTADTSVDLTHDIGARFDICQAYAAAGFNMPCQSVGTSALFRAAHPLRLDSTLNPDSAKVSWLMALPLDTTLLAAHRRIRLDFGWDRRSPWPPYEDFMLQAPKHLPGASDWSYGAHVDYQGIPTMDKDVMDQNPQLVHVQPYITVTSRGKLIWGIPPPKYSPPSGLRVLHTNSTAPFGYVNRYDLLGRRP
jgi:hypothetical protein